MSVRIQYSCDKCKKDFDQLKLVTFYDKPRNPLEGPPHIHLCTKCRLSLGNPDTNDRTVYCKVLNKPDVCDYSDSEEFKKRGRQSFNPYEGCIQEYMGDDWFGTPF
jgi:hypothetical protein